MQNLKEEDLNRDDGIEHGVQPGHAAITTSFRDAVFVKFLDPILLEVFDDLRNTLHLSLRYVW